MPLNVIQAENALAGTTAWYLTNPAQAREIEGFCDAPDVNVGGTIGLKVNCAAAYDMYVYRAGYYGGLGARQVAGPISKTATAQAALSKTNQSGTAGDTHSVIECLWTVTHTLAIPSDGSWPSGRYFVRLVVTSGGNAGKDCYLTFTVRDDARTTAEIVFVESTFTEHAYNPFGGKSLYGQNPNQTTAAYGSIDYGYTGQGKRVSSNRPYTTFRAAGYTQGSNAGAELGIGAGELFTMCNRSVWMQGVDVNGVATAKGQPAWDFDLIRHFERDGYDMRYITDLTLHTLGSAAFTGAKLLAFSAHSEYWTAEMRATVVAAKNAGVGLAFMGSNSIYWRVRLEASNDGTANRTIVCYKDTSDPSATKTFRFIDAGLPEAALVGGTYVSVGVSQPLYVKAASHFLFNGTNAQNGDKIGDDLVGYEYDGVVNGTTPAAATIVAGTGVLEPRDGFEAGTDGSHAMTCYQDPTGGNYVFSAGSQQFAWGLSEHPYLVPALRPARSSALVRKMVRNLFAAMGATARPYTYDVEQRVGSGAWGALTSGTDDLVAAATGLPSGAYALRVRTRDAGGTVSAWQEVDVNILGGNVFVLPPFLRRAVIRRSRGR